MSLVDFQQAFDIEAQPRTFMIIIMVVLSLLIATIAAVLGYRSGDKECNCLSPNNNAFRSFSIAMLAVGFPVILITFIYFGCTTSN